MKYRKKPVVVEVSGQFFENQIPWPDGVFSLKNEVISSGHGVITIHGQVTYVIDGDWIIDEGDGEHFYPCKPDIFEQTYEKA